MRSISLLFAFILFGNSVRAQLTELYKNLQHPESVITDGKFIYVADVGKRMEPLAKDGDGSIRKLSFKGELLSSNLAKTVLNAPKGMAILKDVIYVADVDRIVGISLINGNLINEISFSKFKTVLVNDIVKINDTTIYATATDISKVFKVNLGKVNHITPINIPEIIGANGICYDHSSNRLYVVGLGRFTDKQPTGKIGYISLNKRDPEYIPIPAPTGFYDGVALLDNNSILVSDWRSLQKPDGTLLRINVKTGKSTRLKLSRAIVGPADLWLDRSRNKLLIPEMLEGKILTYQLELAH